MRRKYPLRSILLRGNINLLSSSPHILIILFFLSATYHTNLSYIALKALIRKENLHAGYRYSYLTYISSIDEGDSKRMATFYTQDKEYAPEDYVTVTDKFGDTWEEIKPEAKKAKYLAQAYDAETQTLTLECSLWIKELPDGATQAELRIFSVDNWAYPDELGDLVIDMKQEIHRDFGAILVDIMPTYTRKLMLEEPVKFTNSEDGHSGYILGFELSSGQITWLLDFDEEVWTYWSGSLDSFGETGSPERREAVERQLGWVRCEDEILSDAALITKSGERIPVPGSSGFTTADGVKRLHGSSWEGTIALSDVQAVYLAGNRYELPPCEVTPIGG